MFNFTYVSKTGSKYKALTDAYQETLRKKTKDEVFYYAIKDISLYIANSFEYSLYQKNKSQIEKISHAIFFRYCKFLGISINVSEIEEELLSISERSIYLALGLESYNNRDFIWTEGTFINHTIKKVFNILILEFMREKEALMNLDVPLEYEHYLDSFLDGTIIPNNIKAKLQSYLNDEISVNELNRNDILYLKKAYYST